MGSVPISPLFEMGTDPISCRYLAVDGGGWRRRMLDLLWFG